MSALRSRGDRPRLGPLDLALLGTLLAVWAVCFALQLEGGLRGRFVLSDFVLSSATAEIPYPTVYKLRPSGFWDPSGLMPGDRLLRVGDRDLRGAHWLGAAASLLASSDEIVPVTLERDGESLRSQVRLHPWPFWWIAIPAVIGAVVMVIVLALRAPEWHLTRRVMAAGMLGAIFSTPFHGGPELRTWISFGIGSVCAPLLGTLALWIASDFPRRRLPRTGWPRVVLGLFAAGFVAIGILHGVLARPDDLVTPFARSFFVLWAATLLGVVTFNYRGADPIGRRQVKWIVLGAYLTLVPYTLVTVGWGILPDAWMRVLIALAAVGGVSLPVCSMIAIFGYRFLDIDPLVSATSSYTILSAVVLAGGLAAVPPLAEAASQGTGVDASSAQLVLSALLATVAVPLHRVLRPRLERLFFPQRAMLEGGIHDLIAQVSQQAAARDLITLVGETIDHLVRPEGAVVYARTGQAYEPVFARARTVPPAFEAASPLASTLQTRTSPLASDRFSERDRFEQLTPFDRAALETLGAAVVVPVRARDGLVGFLCLGPKRSGDVYTRTELLLLGAVARTVSIQLERLDQVQVLEEARSMQAELRRYVPGAIARGLEQGADLQPRERVLSVLFVDIRGYTTYSEGRHPHEIFSTVNRYTTTVSSIAEKHGGSIVEFNGDGMMVVFGAPQDLPHKETAAVEAGREIYARVRALEVPTDPPQRISVGVGIATGAVFVGNIQAVDRQIWTAVGNTTNLAARLQSLTRELDAALVIDFTTWRGAGASADDFKPWPQTEIRGRTLREDIFSLPEAAFGPADTRS